ncbi:ATP-binding protein [Gynuella sunshinyii]|uniref:ATP-binding protein n=1 Tax=Gynuella sunshinyii TaxID=1445505 RepID=UPI00146FDF85|nr:ATP-binding protein [Gynuella sunshinyii]
MTILAANLVLAGAFLLANWWSLNHSFLSYLNRIENRHLSPVITNLREHFLRDGDWNGLIVSDDIWKNFVRSSLAFNDRERNFRPENEKPPGPRYFDYEPPFDPGVLPDKPMPPPELFRRLILTDSNKHILHGQLPDDGSKIIWLPIRDDDQVMGYLGAIQRNTISDDMDLLFIKQRNAQTIWILLAAGLVSFLFAVPFANRLLKPIENIQKATRTLADGRFDVSLNTDRNDELGHLARDFNRLAKTLSQNLNARQKWVADISHELRTPIALLQAELEAMIDGVRKVDEASLISLNEEIIRLSFLINDLHELSMSDVGALTYNMQRCNMVGVLEANLETVANGIRISLELQSQAAHYEINGDERRLSQLVRNLVSNTNKYTDCPGTLLVRVSKQEHFVVIDWMDSKPGVPEASLTHIFDRLYRVDSSRNRATGGSGLGLSLVKNIVEAHNGKIMARHSEYGGLWIQIQFPEYGL